MCFLREGQGSRGQQVVNKFGVKGDERSRFPVYHVLSLHRPDSWSRAWVLPQTFLSGLFFLLWLLSDHPWTGQLVVACVRLVLRRIFRPALPSPFVSFPDLQTLWFPFTVQRRCSYRHLFSKKNPRFNGGCCFPLCWGGNSVVVKAHWGALGSIEICRKSLRD